MTLAEPAEAPPKPSRKPMLIGGVLALLLAGAGYFAASSGLIPGFGHAPEEDEAIAELPPLAFISVPPLIVSLGEAQERRHLRFVSQLEVDPAHSHEVELLLPRVADVMNGYLRAVDSETLSDKAGLMRIRAQLLRRVQMVTGEGRVRDLLISEFVLN